MGNCCLTRGSNMVCVGDDADDEWEYVVTPKNLVVAEKEKLFSSSPSSSSLSLSSPSPSSSSSLSSSTISYREVKIRLTKKELERILVGKIDNMEEVTMEQLLSRFLNSSNINSFDFENIQRQQYSWRPRLQSIPEVN